MIYGFDTNIKERAIAAQVIYLVYKSRNTDRFRVSVKMWEQITNFSKLSAKKATNLSEFIERLRKPMCCDVLQPRHCITEKSKVLKRLKDGSIFESGDDARQFLTSMLESSNEKKVISIIINETAFVIMLVRERLEAEKLTNKMEEK
ncbi:hypothetical protein KAU11_05255 [Candidatus Babeliales bacterium]|nr:hypothetical protein [Candidatus Babeliales bacterium]